MTFAEAVAKIERDLFVSDEIGFPAAAAPSERDWSRAPNGKSYVTIDCGGLKIDGEASAYRATEEDAIESWLKAVRTYIPTYPGTLYWRERPQMSNRGDIRGKRGKFTIYSRLQCSPANHEGIA